jgi:cyclic pyranopterin phosphate synthase
MATDTATLEPTGSTPATGENLLIDPYDRHVSYLRVSVTDRCDFRCVYCMSENMTFLPKSNVLSLEELDRLCSAFVTRGVRKLRISGGEPLVRRDIMWLFERLGRHLVTGALEELTLTTNGSQLERYATALYAAGVRRVNVSIDTLDPQSDRRNRSRRGCRPQNQDQRRRAQRRQR